MKTSKKAIVFLVIGILVFFSATIIIRFVSRQVLIERMGMDNAITRLVFFDDKMLSENEQSKAIDWEKLYPFSESQQPIDANILTRYLKIHDRIKTAVDDYTSTHLIFRNKTAELSYSIEKLIGWNYAAYSEYNAVTILSDGYLVEYEPQKDMQAAANALQGINTFCQSNNIQFLFVNPPSKMSKYQDNQLSGVVDFSNQNKDILLSILADNNIDYLDVRDTLETQTSNHHSLFYDTDHHWKQTTALLAAKDIYTICNEQYGWNVDLDQFELKNYEEEIYPSSFLGSQGKKVTLSRVSPDDFSLLYPKFATQFHFVIPTLDFDRTGDYSVMYDKSRVRTTDYYGDSPYRVFCYGDNALSSINNLMDCEEKTIVFIHDSFGDCVTPFLASGVQTVYSLDIRHFTGSVQSFIKEKNPDLVIVLYSSPTLGEMIDYSSHTDPLDFN